jgi:hypothetical protein
MRFIAVSLRNISIPTRRNACILRLQPASPSPDGVKRNPGENRSIPAYAFAFTSAMTAFGEPGFRFAPSGLLVSHARRNICI